MKRVGQQGVGAVAVILVIVILGLVGFTGWFVWHSNQETNKALGDSTAVSDGSVTASPKQKSSTAKTDEAATDGATYVVAKQVAVSTLPGGLRTGIITTTEEKSPSCVKDGALVDIDGNPSDPDVWYTTSGFAEATIGCDGGAATIFAKSGGSWKLVESTQFSFSCDKLKAAKVPVAFLKSVSPEGAAMCLSGENQIAYEL